MSRINAPALAAALVLLAGCGAHGGASPADAPDTRAFPVVQVPSIYTDAPSRQAYMVEHYWDRFLSASATYHCDSLTINGVPEDAVEEQFATFAALLGEAPIDVARAGSAALFRKVEALQQADSLSNVFERFTDLANKYFYDVNSPFRNEDIYLPYLRGLLASPLTPQEMVPAYTFDAQMCEKNSIGTPAADFRFVDMSGRSHTLYGVRADYTLLFFSNPGCEACKEIIDTLRASVKVSALIEAGVLAVVNVYIDEDIQAWRDYQSYYPADWYNGYDPSYTIRQDVSYNVRAIPSVYILDGSKNVILKDAPEGLVFAFLEGIGR